MSTQASYFKLGIFVVVATFLLVAGVIVLGAGKLFEPKLVIETYMDHSVVGLSEGSAIKYKGVDFGEVSRISLAATKYDPDLYKQGRIDSPILVELSFKRNMLLRATEEELLTWLDQAVEAGLRVRMASSGLTGPPFIEIVYLDPEKFPPLDIRWTPPRFYIPSAPSSTQVLFESVQEILGKLSALDYQKVFDDLDTLLLNANEKVSEFDVSGLVNDASATLEDLRTKIDDVDTKAISDRIKEILDNPNIDESLEDLRASLQNAKDATARIDELLKDPRVDELLTNLDEASGELSPTLQDLRRAVRRIDLLIAAERANIESVIEELNRAMINIRAVTEDAKENPSRILFGEPPPRSKTGNEQ